MTERESAIPTKAEGKDNTRFVYLKSTKRWLIDLELPGGGIVPDPVGHVVWASRTLAFPVPVV